ncbi:NAD-dependent epimerase/dehydratase family protein [Cognatiluteimonas telluris]|uniref:NAD-dependent epimerase/dehydratase family protein n=1 Tax=Cognatiluteimonas telluris TaxID=1104775 RepID=UPI001407DB82|nr:NAD(P)-dependent oxidoreductase [Lysobacter telluris]
MRLLIIGGHGAIGSAIARHADSVGIDTHVGARAASSALRLGAPSRIGSHALDAGDVGSVRSIIAAVQPDAIVMAALPQAGHADDADARHALLSGMGAGVLGVLEGARAAGFHGPMAWIGSAMCYGEGGQPRRVDAALRPQTFRGAVKAAESLLVAQLAAQFDIDLTEVRVFTGYGPYEQRERLVASLLRAALRGGRVRLAPTPARRDWIHYDDIARACLAVLSVPSGASVPKVANACSGTLHDTHEVARLLERITGAALVDAAAYEAADRYGDVEPGCLPLAADGLDWRPRVDLAQGLQACWDWARSPSGRQYLLADARP